MMALLRIALPWLLGAAALAGVAAFLAGGGYNMAARKFNRLSDARTLASQRSAIELNRRTNADELRARGNIGAAQAEIRRSQQWIREKGGEMESNPGALINRLNRAASN